MRRLMIALIFSLLCLILFQSKAYALSQFNAPANVVIGQPDFTTVLNQHKDISFPISVYADNGKLYVSEYSWSDRISVFNHIPTQTQHETDFVIGLPNLDAIGFKGIGNNHFSSVQGIVIAQGRLFVAEFGNNRILVYNTVPTASNAAADLVIGQPDFTSNTANNGGISAHSINTPRGVWSDGTRLIVLDTGNNRVLIWNTLPTTSNQDADVVLGQPDFTSNTGNNGGISAHSIYKPSRASVYESKLYVTDGSNNRVLIWNTIPTTNNKDADLVLGQPDFTHNTANNGGISAHSMSDPRQVHIADSKLYLADYANNRVLIWNTIPTTNNKDADVVLGQPDFTHNTLNNGGVSASSLYNPVGITTDGTKLFIADYANSRVLVYNSTPSSNGAAADYVLGQYNFEDNKPFSPGQPTASNLRFPMNVAIVNNKMAISDLYRNRILFFNSIPTTSNTAADFVLGQTSFSLPSNGVAPTPTSSSIASPGKLIAVGQKLIVADGGEHRVLIYNTFPTTSGAAADIVIGQPDLNSNTANNGGRSASSLNGSAGVCSDGTKLVISDGNNHRILIFNTIPTVSHQAADVVLGQPDFASGTANNGGVSAHSLNYPLEVSCTSGKLAVVDYMNSRLLIWNSIPTTNNKDADVVVGQPDFTHNAVNNGGISGGTLNYPRGAAYDGVRLLISDTYNNRVLIWNQLPTSNGALADVVIGQKNFTSNIYNDDYIVKSGSVAFPAGMGVNGNKLFVAESLNQRVEIFNLGPQHTSVTLPAYSTSATALLTLTADDAKDMMISDNASFTDAAWESFATSKALTLSAGDGTKTYYVKMRDFANYESSTFTVSTVLDTTMPIIPKITNVGRINNVPDKTPLYYYFTSQFAQIKGTAEAGSTIHFKYGSKDFSAKANSSGEFTVTVTGLPRELVEFTYYTQDLAGNKSASRILKLMIGEENFPAYLVSSTITPTITPTPTTTAMPTGSSTQTPTPTITVYGMQVTDEKGNVLANTTVYINGQKYETDKNGKVYLPQKPTNNISVEIDGRKYEGSVLGNTIQVQGNQLAKNNVTALPYLLGLAVIIIIGGIIVTRRKGQ